MKTLLAWLADFPERVIRAVTGKACRCGLCPPDEPSRAWLPTLDQIRRRRG